MKNYLFLFFQKNAHISIFVYNSRLIKLSWKYAWLLPDTLRIARALAIREGGE